MSEEYVAKQRRGPNLLIRDRRPREHQRAMTNQHSPNKTCAHCGRTEHPTCGQHDGSSVCIECLTKASEVKDVNELIGVPGPGESTLSQGPAGSLGEGAGEGAFEEGDGI